jgi:RNA polymerase sigma factor (sigma-70 family)
MVESFQAMMTEAIRALLQRAMVGSYRTLLTRLTRRLGSPDLAIEALHETWIRLERSNLNPVTDPEAYLYRAALNTASNLRVAEKRHLSKLEIDGLMEVESFEDESPDQARILESREEFSLLEKALQELPPRQRIVLAEALTEDETYETLARRHGVSTRTIQNDLRQAAEHCARRLGQETIFAFRRRGLSRKVK